MNGSFVREWGKQGYMAGEFQYPKGVTVSLEGEVIVSDFKNHRLQVFGLDGTFRRYWGHYCDTNGQFKHHRNVTATDMLEQMKAHWHSCQNT